MAAAREMIGERSIHQAKTSPRAVTATAARYVLCVLIAALTVFPFLWMVSTSFKLPSEAITLPPQWIPSPFTLENYTKLFTSSLLPFPIFFLNSLKITSLVVIGRLFVCSLGAYGFARLEFPGRDAAFAMLLASLMVPEVVQIIPLYIGYAQIGWIDTHWPLIIPPIVANTFGTFLLRQFFLSIPKDLEEAATIDGANHFDIYWRIMLPLAKPALATLAIFTFMASWNDFLHPLIFLNSTQNFTLTVGLAFFQGQAATDYTRLMAGVVVSVLPIMVVYAAAQQYFTRGVILSGVKG
ncbi:MAG: carbohydrate ABC transporter permease [Chloroflexota bacterium]